MELKDLKGVGPARIKLLRAMGINSLRDLLFYFPIRYEDHVHVTEISKALETETMIQGVIREKPGISYYRGISRVTAVIRDQTGALSVCWYNEPWIIQQLPLNKEILLYGRISGKNGRPVLSNPRLIREKGWMPIYRTVRGMPLKTLQQLMKEALSLTESVCRETLPAGLRVRHKLLSLPQSVKQAHFPEDPEQMQAARRRLDFESMLIYMMGVSLFQHLFQPGWPMRVREEEISSFWQKMPFTPTDAQKRVLHEIAADLRKERAMSRLVQGDVGCGKTVLAFGAIYLAWKQGFQSAMMAPTEILARQHYESARIMLEPIGIECGLLTGSTKAAERRALLKRIREGTCHAIFGTHALLSEGVDYARLGLAITDEQHRFGVRQRSALQEKGTQAEKPAPHVLVMSATPIPRSLALILYGDLDISVVDELPPGRKTVQTRIVPEEKREAMLEFLRKTLTQTGNQAYIVCPLVEDSEEMPELRSAKAVFRELSEKWKDDLRIGLTWGMQKSEDKEDVLGRFSAGKLDVLVATTVIEVGVNVPNATIMIVENAERYGLSQLHQLRGRVGRGSQESWCFLRSDAAEKLRILSKTQDGFEIARKDLEIRGPGDLMGTRQSGEASRHLPGAEDYRLLEEVQRCVKELIENQELATEKQQVEAIARKAFTEKDFEIALN